MVDEKILELVFLTISCIFCVLHTVPTLPLDSQLLPTMQFQEGTEWKFSQPHLNCHSSLAHQVGRWPALLETLQFTSSTHLPSSFSTELCAASPFTRSDAALTLLPTWLPSFQMLFQCYHLLGCQRTPLLGQCRRETFCKLRATLILPCIVLRFCLNTCSR